jgi:signal transduction histidine kinase/ligand-binding sensor domain-containing protein/CheY-like chemotaxis protein
MAFRNYISVFLLSLSGSVSLCFGQIKLEPLKSEMAQSLVRDIHRDHEGYLWIANNGIGLMKYNSHIIFRYLHDDSDNTSMTDDGVMVLEQDSSKNLWIGTINGLNRYRPYKDNFTQYFKITGDSTSLSDNFINEIYLDNKGILWVLTANGLCEYLPDKDHFKRYFIPDSPIANCFSGMDQDSTGNYWVTTTSNGIYQFKPQSKTFIYFPDNKTEKDQLFSKKILIDSHNNFWIGNWGEGLAQFDPKAKTFKYWPITQDGSGPNKKLVMNMLEWHNDQLLIAVDQGGINILDQKTGTFSYIKNNDPLYGTLSSSGVCCLHYDKEGILWVGTSRGGVFYFNPKENLFNAFSNNGVSIELKDGVYSIPINSIISCFFEDSEGIIWIGTDSGGLSAFDRDTKKFRFYTFDPSNKHSISSNVIRSIAEDSRGNIYVATWDGGINKFDKQTGLFSPAEFKRNIAGSYRGQNLWNISSDSQNRLWISFPTGEIDLYDEDKNLLGQYFSEPNPEIYHMSLIFEDVQHRIYVNTVTGVFQFQEGGKYFKRLVALREVTFINVNFPDVLWVGTQKQGLFLCARNGQIIKNFTTKNGLPDNYISSIISGSNNDLWLSTNNGLCHFNTKTEKTTNYYREDALPGNHFFVQSSLKTRDGEIFFGEADGFISFYPGKLPQNTTLPEVYITNFYLNNKKVNFRDKNSPISKPLKYIDEINLKYNERILSFDFQAINFTFPHKSRYKYMLEGFEKNWHETNAQSPNATYTNLDPGNYVFKVMAANSDGLWNEKPATVIIKIRPPFWKTRLFLVLIILAGAALVLFIIKLRNRKLLSERAKLQQKVEARTQVIETQARELSQQNKLLENQKEELQVQRDELAKHEQHLEQLVEERTSDLKIAKEKAEKSDKLKSFFLANMSHEIRTPMNAIVGFATLLDIEPDDSSKKSEFVELIKSNADSLRYLIEDILDFSMIEANQLKIHIKKFSLNSFIDNIFSSFALQNENPNVNVLKNNQLHTKDITLISDEFRIRQIIFNLLNNALKFTERGFVELSAYWTEANLVFSVTDSGPGISKSEQEIIFNQFVKLEREQYTAKKGIGLGLAISKRLSILLGAQLQVESELGKGSTFSLIFPLNIALQDSELDYKTTTIFLHKNWSNKSILVIEDENSNYRFLYEVLKPTKISIFWAKDGSEAVEYFKKGHRFDIALLDIKMPKMDGFETLAHIRKMAPTQIVIAQTAYAQIEDELKIREEGFDDYLAKPINPDHLLNTIANFLEK